MGNRIPEIAARLGVSLRKAMQALAVPTTSIGNSRNQATPSARFFFIRFIENGATAFIITADKDHYREASSYGADGVLI
jgi:hypothetical protein